MKILCKLGIHLAHLDYDEELKVIYCTKCNEFHGTATFNGLFYKLKIEIIFLPQRLVYYFEKLKNLFFKNNSKNEKETFIDIEKYSNIVNFD